MIAIKRKLFTNYYCLYLCRIRYTKQELLDMAATLYQKTEGYSKWLDVVKKHLGQGKTLGDKFGGLIDN